MTLFRREFSVMKTNNPRGSGYMNCYRVGDFSPAACTTKIKSGGTVKNGPNGQHLPKFFVNN